MLKIPDREPRKIVTIIASVLNVVNVIAVNIEVNKTSIRVNSVIDNHHSENYSY